MKRYLISLILGFAFIAQAQTWIIHNAKDNYMYVCIYGEQVTIDCGSTWTSGPGYIVEAYWDFWNDYTYPQWAYSGSKSGALQCDGTWSGSSVVGYADSYTFIYPNGTLGGTVVSGGGTEIDFQIWYISASDYSGDQTFTPPPAGEWWIDFASDGSVRISSVAPLDFGKWAWNGTVNQSWVEPLAGKRLAKGHKK